MSDSRDYLQTQKLLEENELFLMPSEIHGIISGLLACGVDIDSDAYLGFLSDILNDGLAFSKPIKHYFAESYSEIKTQLNNPDFSFDLYLPDEDETLSDRANALVAWVSGFLLGFGLKQQDLGKVSDEVKEVVKDFTEITRLDTSFDESEEDSQAFFEVTEYVRMSVLLCYNELGKKLAANQPASKTLH